MTEHEQLVCMRQTQIAKLGWELHCLVELSERVIERAQAEHDERLGALAEDIHVKAFEMIKDVVVFDVDDTDITEDENNGL